MNIKHRLAILSVILAASCTSPKEIIYMQDIDEVKLDEITSRYEAKIKKDDLLTIVVSGPDKQVVMPYNLTLSDTSYGNAYNPENTTLPYLVDSNGEINFPILGKIKVEGMTRSQLVEYLTEEISMDVKDPIVYVSFKNYKITVLGEVRSPGTYTMQSEKITIFQALSCAGDLALTADRDGMILIREVDGRNTYHRIDLRSAEFMNEDYFFMQQNDVIYVPASAKRVAAATTNTAIWSIVLSTVTSAIAVVSFIFSVSK